MKTIFIFVLCICKIVSFAQSITNVSSSQQGNNAVITYDLNGAPGDSYFIKLYYSTDDGYGFSQALNHVSGDVKNGVKTGPRKKIVWEAEKEVNFLNGPVVFKVEADARKITSIPSTKIGITVDVSKASRIGDRITIDFIINQNTEYENIRAMLMQSSRLILQDGTQVEPITGNLGVEKIAKTTGDPFYVDCPAGVPTKGTLVFKIENSDLVYPGVKFDLRIFSDNSRWLGEQNFVVRNVPVQ